jgi:Delta3-Delta2-enoyl-CoA isomerase
MGLVEYTLDEHVAVVTMNSGENRFNPVFLNEFINILSEIEKKTDARTLVVTSAHEKIWSNGIDLDWLAPAYQAGDVDTLKSFLYLLNNTFKKLLLYPMPTIAAINGHAFAGGAIISCAFDFRFMRSDRGFFCFPEVDIHIPFLPGMIAICAKAIPMWKFEELKYTGKRATADECAAAHIVTKACHNDVLMDDVMAFAKSMNKSRHIIRVMKERMNAAIIRAIDEEDPPLIEQGKLNV